ncbi:MAG TPA: hypothetical protein VMF65_07585 [Acidimicrobiales bacterium]|nr:hypothetical protein [Acidimicrobiales bacterium]
MPTDSASRTATMAFALRGAEGRVTITYSVNSDPARWGFNLLGLSFGAEVARGFPVVQAKTSFPREGYAALLGWVQVVDYVVARGGIPDEKVWVVPDVPPQSREANTPYLAFGIDPVLFDAPAFTEKDVDWTARSFLTFTPDCLMTPVVEPLCGFRWGYVVADGVVTPKELAPSSEEDWVELRRMLRVRLPTWTFGGEDWTPPAFEP